MDGLGSQRNRKIRKTREQKDEGKVGWIDERPDTQWKI